MNTQVEYAVLACIINHEPALFDAISELRSSDFHSTICSQAFESIIQMIEEGVIVDETLIKSKMNSSKFNDIYNRFIKTVDIEYTAYKDYFDELKKGALMRTATTILSDGVKALKKEDVQPDKIVRNIEGQLITLVIRKGGLTFSTLHDDIDGIVDRLKKKQQIEPAIRTGIDSLDSLLMINKGDFIIIAGRPSMGKTVFANNILANVGFKENKPILFFSVEMNKTNQWQRILSYLTKIPLYKIRKGQNITESDWKIFNKYYDNIKSNRNIMINDLASIDITTISAMSRKEKVRNPDISAIIIDYIGLLVEGTDMLKEVTSISKGLKVLARDLDIPVIALSQLSRKCEDREDKRPRLSDLRESGSLEQDADSVLLLFRPFYYTKDNSDATKAEIIIAKQRDGETGTVLASFEKDTVTFS